MKTITHIVLPIVILMGIVGIVAYVTQNTQRSPKSLTIESANESKPPPPPKLISFVESLDASTEQEPPEQFEAEATNHKDFVFYSTQENNIRLTADYQSCKCTTVELGTLSMSEDELAAIDKSPSLSGYCRLVAAMNSMTFASLPSGVDDKEPGTLIPGAPKGKPKRPYILRVVKRKIQDEQLGKLDSIKIRIGARVDGSSVKSNIDKAISYVVIAPAGIFPATIVDMGEIGAGGERAIACYVYSGTRDQLSFTPRLAGADGGETTEPCAEISPLTTLSPEERDILPKTYVGPNATGHIRCAYRFTITLHERRGDNLLEIGPLKRHLVITFTAGAGELPITTMTSRVEAIVHGPIHVLNGDERGRIPLGTYKSNRGTSRIVRLASDDPKLDIEVDGTSDPKLKATLRPPTVDSRKEWEMLVEVGPDAFVGDLPGSTMITLRTVGPNPRRMRIPVTGKGER
jgi:hypothetical protein